MISQSPTSPLLDTLAWTTVLPDASTNSRPDTPTVNDVVSSSRCSSSDSTVDAGASHAIIVVPSIPNVSDVPSVV